MECIWLRITVLIRELRDRVNHVLYIIDGESGESSERGDSKLVHGICHDTIRGESEDISDDVFETFGLCTRVSCGVGHITVRIADLHVGCKWSSSSRCGTRRSIGGLAV